ncbi:Uncharacterized membrane protein YhaH, DUF805 family [Pseudomonas peli]|uniref:Uncharacterized membrane protein YhaH, DUF805 family n=1 Tax=Pseudomonas peli TaxID=592361 RepID=A0AB37ZCR0_9PSED|nr:DUF805 domain-containing protein [Pseudomonas peli]NMZ67235.1 DUF805 domain-containing protein [Pseudomonas peli]OHC28944.1 MAG: hypothetical protein A3J71_03560 [Pseudomonadales bacterium RIFCSPHIGHO2_02_FULL_60_43]SCW88132.1 Uncharacterized membrane protein YhaH, DUF805 family [Pseudomonas peli]
MTQARFKIVFNGELMPDVSLETAKENLARLFKSDLTRINSLFSGGNVDIKRDLSENEADQYLKALQSAGAKVRKEQDLAASLSLVETDDHRTESSEAESNVLMTCPKCGHQQSKAIECSACGIVIEKFIARQAMLAENPPEVVSAAATPYATPKAAVAEALPEFGELKAFTTDGRIGRLRYLAWSMVLMLACLPLFGIAGGFFVASEILGGLLMVVVGIAVAVVGIMIGVQRLHDIGWSGWLLLVTLVPIVGGVFSLLMFIIPGSTAANRFGPPPPPNSRAVKILALLWVAIIVIGIVAAIALPAYMGYADAGL